MFRFFRISGALVALLLPLVLVACANKTVPLAYTPVGPAAHPAPGATMVTLVALQDQRPDVTKIGTRRDGTPFTPAGSVTDWVSRALADELTRQGLLVSYTDTPIVTTDGATGMNLVSGTIDDLSLMEDNFLNYAVKIAITLRITDKNGKLLSTESFRITQTATSMPTEDNIRDLLTDSLRDVVAPAALKVRQTLK